MSTGLTLVISNPPHGTFEPRQAGEALGLLPVEATLKAHYPVPEIWVAAPPAEAEAAARKLIAAGLHVVALPAEKLAAIGESILVESFQLTATGIDITHQGKTTKVAAADRAFVVFCKPRDGREDDKTAARSSQAYSRISQPFAAPSLPGEHPETAFIDLYVRVDQALQRFRFNAHDTSFSGFGHEAAASGGAGLLRLVNHFETHFKLAVIDRRLVNMHVRQKARNRPSPEAQRRKGYSYDSPGLNELLTSLPRDLHDVSQTELSSRLTFLTGIAAPAVVTASAMHPASSQRK